MVRETRVVGLELKPYGTKKTTDIPRIQSHAIRFLDAISKKSLPA